MNHWECCLLETVVAAVVVQIISYSITHKRATTTTERRNWRESIRAFPADKRERGWMMQRTTENQRSRRINWAKAVKQAGSRGHTRRLRGETRVSRAQNKRPPNWPKRASVCVCGVRGSNSVNYERTGGWTDDIWTSGGWLRKHRRGAMPPLASCVIFRGNKKSEAGMTGKWRRWWRQQRNLRERTLSLSSAFQIITLAAIGLWGEWRRSDNQFLVSANHREAHNTTTTTAATLPDATTVCKCLYNANAKKAPTEYALHTHSNTRSHRKSI